MKFRLEPKKLGKMLSQLRQNASLSQAKISQVCEVNSPQYISNIERGQCLPSLKILKIMLSKYNVSNKDKQELISLFLEAAQTEMEDIFQVNIELKLTVSDKKEASESFIKSPSIPYSLGANAYNY